MNCIHSKRAKEYWPSYLQFLNNALTTCLVESSSSTNNTLTWPCGRKLSNPTLIMPGGCSCNRGCLVGLEGHVAAAGGGSPSSESSSTTMYSTCGSGLKGTFLRHGSRLPGSSLWKCSVGFFAPSPDSGLSPPFSIAPHASSSAAAAGQFCCFFSTLSLSSAVPLLPHSIFFPMIIPSIWEPLLLWVPMSCLLLAWAETSMRFFCLQSTLHWGDGLGLKSGSQPAVIENQHCHHNPSSLHSNYCP